MAVDGRLAAGHGAPDPEPIRSHVPCRVGVWGLFDADGNANMLDGLVTRRELLRRLPSADVRLFAPFGHLRPSRLDRGEAVEPLLPWSERRIADLAQQLDFVVIGPGRVVGDDERLAANYGHDADEVSRLSPSRFFVEGLGPELEKLTPAAWYAVGVASPLGPDEADRVQGASADRAWLSVRDEASKLHLEHAGVGSPIAVVPDPAILLPRLFPAPLLEKRLAYLRLMGWFPRHGDAVVVEAVRDLEAWIPSLGAALGAWLDERPDSGVVVAGAADDRVPAALDAALGSDRLYRLPIVVGNDDLVAAISGSQGFVGSSRPGVLAAVSYARPSVVVSAAPPDDVAALLGMAGQAERVVTSPSALGEALPRLLSASPSASELADLQARVDAHFDRLAELAVTAFTDKGGAGRRTGMADSRIVELEARLEALGRAHEVRGQRLVIERSALADELADVHRALARESSELDRARRQLHAEVPRRIAAEAELDALRATRTFRWTALARAAYRRLRGLSGRQGPSGPLSGRQGPSGPLSGRQGPSGPLSGRQGAR